MYMTKAMYRPLWYPSDFTANAGSCPMSSYCEKTKTGAKACANLNSQ
jgi:hypothetical protein